MVTQMNAFERLVAAGLGRLLQQMVSGPYAILSADRVGMTREQRDAARMRLKNMLRELGYGWVDTRGASREGDQDEYSMEDSVFVPGMSSEEAARIGRALDQYSVIVGDRGTFSFLNLKPQPGDPDSDGVERLEDHIVIPDLSSSPNMYTEVGRRKFELHLPDPDEKAIPGGRFSPEGIARVREQLDRIGRPRPAVHEDAFLAHAYAGPPPHWMIPVSGLRFAGSKKECKGQTGGLPLIDFDRLAYFIPFVAESREVPPHFDPSPRWGEPVPVPVRGTGVRTASLMDLDEFVPRDPEAYEDALGNVARFRGGVTDLFRTQRPGTNNVKGFDSLYVGPSGNVFMLDPHQHNETARRVLRTVHPELPANPVKRVAGGYTHTDLTLASGIQRIQIYRDGMGVTVEMCRPPNGLQLGAVREAYMLTPMERFVAEINVAGTTIGWFTSFGELVEFVNGWDPTQPEEMVRRWPWLVGVLGEGG